MEKIQTKAEKMDGAHWFWWARLSWVQAPANSGRLGSAMATARGGLTPNGLSHCKAG